MSASNLHIIPGPSERLETEHVEEKWCFACRKHLPHRWIVTYDPPPTYYDPSGHWECPSCGDDKTRFGDGW